ncbi:MAG: S-layer homology domain-containing protein, partial [Clostridia bacterium]|nr:S-layer homology domain-containing protein [Clostridia bacterium]
MVSRRFLKTVLSMLCVFTIALGCVCTVSADEKNVMFDLTSLGILEGMEVSEEIYGTNITRAEFSQLVVNLLGYTELAKEYENKGVFADISDCEYKGAINLLYELKVISGTGANTFSPDSTLTYQQVGKFIVNILGYANIVNSTELAAYSMLAGSLGVYKDVDSSGVYVTWKDALIMIHNALDIDIMTKNFGMIGNNYHVVEGKTIRTSLATTAGQVLKRYKGIVTADATTYLYQAHPNMKSNQVEINGKIYKCNFDVPSGLVGMEVNFYVDYTEDKTGVVTSIDSTSKNTVTKFSLDKLSYVSGDEVK